MASDKFVTSLGAGLVWCGLVVLAVTPSLAKDDIAEEAKKEVTAADRAAAAEKDVTQGALRIVGEDATVVECPLKHTDVQADISGFIARVKVTQTFVNPTKEKIEAVYVFPLPNQAAVDDMTMVVGERRIVGVIKRRDAARQIYEEALARGQTAALLEQERPNIFTQSVGNIEPGQTVNIEISYVDVLNYDQGTYGFHFPMVVGPRYNPQKSPGQPVVADAAKINPPVLKPKERTSHDISLAVNLDAGVPIQNLTNANHKVHTVDKGETKARVRLLQEDSIPNKDFVLRYDVVGDKPEMAMLAHTGDFGDSGRVGDGYFMLMIQPKEDERLKKSPPREIVFLVDVSGSMSGQPTATTRAAMEEMLKLCRGQDTLQVVTFASQAYKLFDKPVAVNDENIKKAVSFSRSFRGGGGTRMLEGVKLAIDQPIDKKRLRIIVMLSDGYIGNEAQIIEHVGKNCGDQIRFWALGVGSSPNMFLIDGVAKQGGGMGKRLGLNDDTKTICTEVITRIQRAQLAKIKIDWGDLQVSETFPARLPELWAGRPVIVYGRYRDGGDSKISISGNVEGEDVSWPLTVSLPANEPEHDVLAKVWARKKIEDVMHQSYYAGSPAVEEDVTALALRYRLMSQYTSFVAVDEKEAGSLDEPARPPRRMAVPVPLPEGTRYEGFFGGEGGGAGDFGLGDDGVVDSLDLRFATPRFALVEKAKEAKMNNHLGGTNTYFLRTFGRPAPAPAFGEQKPGSGLPSRRAWYDPATPANGKSGGFGDGGFYYSSGLARRGQSISQQRGLSLYDIPTSRGGRANDRFGRATRELLLTGESAPKDEGEALAFGNAWYALSPMSGETLKLAQAAWKAVAELKQKGDLEEARRAATRAYFLDAAAANFGQSNGEIASQALEALDSIHSSQVAGWTKSDLRLSTKLDLVLRDRSLSEALSDIAKASGVKVALLDGSQQDAASLQLKSEIRINYLDLRRATVAQALDWLLQPARLTWWVTDKGIQVGSERRREGITSWIYDVSLIAVPTAKELGDVKDRAKQLEAAKHAADQFIEVIRKDLGVKDNSGVVWYSPGQLLVVADKNTHEATSGLLATLTNGESKPKGAAAAIVEMTRKRAAERENSVAKQTASRHRLDVAMQHNHFGWQLLAAAAGGKLDLEALTELQVAWKDEATAELLAGDASDLALRSLWMISEASRALPDEAELKRLASDARMASRNVASKAVLALQSKPDDADAFVRVLFSSLALIDDADYRADSFDALKNSKTEESGMTQARTIALSLLGNRDDIDQAVLSNLVSSGVSSDEMTTLLAMACHRAGGDVWQSFRIASEELIGKQPLRGEVVVIVNRLTLGQLQVAGR